MKSWSWGAVALVVVCVAGCSSTASTHAAGKKVAASAPDSPSVSASSASPTASALPTSQRGNIIKKVGDDAGIRDDDGNPAVDFKVTSITPDAKCTGESAADFPSQNGHMLVIGVSASVAPGAAAALDGQTVDFDEGSWEIIGDDGLTEAGIATVAGTACIPDNQQIETVGVGESAVGQVALDTKYEHGTLVFKPYWGGDTGWEWTF